MAGRQLLRPQLRGTAPAVPVCYNSPASSQQCNEDLLLMREAAANDKDSDHVLLMGDFNYPEINYEDYMVEARVDSDPYKFFMKTQDLFSVQNVLDCRLHDSDMVFVRHNSIGFLLMRTI